MPINDFKAWCVKFLLLTADGDQTASQGKGHSPECRGVHPPVKGKIPATVAFIELGTKEIPKQIIDS